MKEKFALGFAAALTAVALYLVPSWQTAFTDPCHLAGILAAGTIVLLLVTRHVGRRGIVIERRVLALFLAGMPLVYVASWLVTRGAGTGGGWLWVEIAGIPLYTALAILGIRRSPWLLAAGIAAHGVAWDSWHYFTKTTYIPAWYAIGCFLVDIGLGIYIVTRIPAWQAAEATEIRQNQQNSLKSIVSKLNQNSFGVVMAQVCEICGKGPQFGNNISHAHNVTKRRWNVNLRPVHAKVKGVSKRIRVCTSCLRSGKVQKA